MDQHTEKGIKANSETDLALAILGKETSKFFYQTPNKKASKIDGVIIDAGKVVGLFEVKSRYCTEEKFFNEYKGEALMTYDKLWHAYIMCEAFKVSFSVIYHLVPSRMIMCKTILSPEAEQLVPITIRRSKTPKSVNGGEVMRNNAYIQMIDPRIFRY